MPTNEAKTNIKHPSECGTYGKVTVSLSNNLLLCVHSLYIKYIYKLYFTQCHDEKVQQRLVTTFVHETKSGTNLDFDLLMPQGES